MHKVASWFVGRSNSVRKTRPLAIMGDDSPGSHGSFPKNILARTKFDGRFAVTNSRGIRSPELRPLRRAGEARQNDGKKSGPRSVRHYQFRLGLCPSV